MTENDAIARAVQHYVDGAKSGSSAEMRRAYTDLFTLLKVDGHWKITNKVFHINADSR
jgi:Putative lumazine-binding